jgi:hypothetical protein
VAEWVKLRAVWLHYATIQTDPGSNPGAGTINQAIHSSGIVKLLTVSMQRVTTVEGCEGKACIEKELKSMPQK